jgi:D-lactate dehydrogenase
MGSTCSVKNGFAINKIFGKNAMIKMTGGIKKVIPAMPLWSNYIHLPPALSIIKSKKQTSKVAESKVVYFPACISRMLGTYEGKKKNLIETFMSICNKSDIEVIVLDNVNGSCCSQIFSSKGFSDAYRFTANRIVEQIWKTSREGTLPIVIDVSSCAYTLHNIRPVLTDENKSKFDQPNNS